MASFNDKVAALKLLRERKLARQAAQTETTVVEVDTDDADGTKAALPADEKPVCLPREPTSVGGADTTATAGKAAEQKSTDLCGSEDETDGEPEVSREADELFCLGHCFERGLHGYKNDYQQAAEFYQLSAEQGHTVAQWRLGELCEYGHGMEKNEEEAARWYRLAAEAGHSHAQFGLALQLEDGRGGLNRDDAAAFVWYQRAAEQGHTIAQYCAACCLSEGRGTAKDSAKALRLLEQSAAAGCPMAEEALSSSNAGVEPTAEYGAGLTQESSLEDAGLLDLAMRVAEQLRDLGDEDSEKMLEELLDDTPWLRNTPILSEDLSDAGECLTPCSAAAA